MNYQKKTRKMESKCQRNAKKCQHVIRKIEYFKFRYVPVVWAGVFRVWLLENINQIIVAAIFKLEQNKTIDKYASRTCMQILHFANMRADKFFL